MCEKCDADFAAMTEDELRAEARNLAGVAGQLICSFEPTSGGAIALMALGKALQLTMERGLEASTTEQLTPTMKGIAEKVGTFAADLLREAYQREPLIVAPAPGLVVPR